MSSPINRVFIVPYRDRVHQKFFFSKHMTFILEDKMDYEILFIHQNDDRPFNRGAMKNIGFIAVKKKYPETYKNINLIFHDIDTLPFHKIFDYNTEDGVVKHYYGFTTALGGILVIKGGDFEKLNGFPNFWGWGLEDTNLQQRCDNYQLKIDRSHFYSLGSPEILHLFDGLKRIVSKEEPTIHNKNMVDGIVTISNLEYKRESKSSKDDDNVYTWDNDNIWYINVDKFNTLNPYKNHNYRLYDLRDPPSVITSGIIELQKTKNTSLPPQDWKNIKTPTIISPQPQPQPHHPHPPITQQHPSNTRSNTYIPMGYKPSKSFFFK